MKLFLISLLCLSFTSFAFSCPEWTQSYASKCYLFKNTTYTDYGSEPPNLSFLDAEASCNCFGGHLATIDSLFDNLYVNKQLDNNNAWIGAVAVFNQTKSSNYTWSWTEGRPIGYSAWANTYQTNLNTAGYFSSGKWNTFDTKFGGCECYEQTCQGDYCNCDSTVCIGYYVCQIPNDGLHCPRSNGSKYWSYYSPINTCYQIDKQPGTFDQAFDKCDQLLSIHSQKESDILLSYFASNRIVGSLIWVGIMDAYKNGNWTWSDGSPVNYTNWAPGEPQKVGINDCAVFQYDSKYKAETPFWKSTPCTSSAVGVCETPAQLQNDQSYPSVCDNGNSFNKKEANAQNAQKQMKKKPSVQKEDES